MEQDVLLLTDELLAPTLPAEKKEGEDDKAAEKEKKAWIKVISLSVMLSAESVSQ